MFQIINGKSSFCKLPFSQPLARGLHARVAHTMAQQLCKDMAFLLYNRHCYARARLCQSGKFIDYLQCDHHHRHLCRHACYSRRISFHRPRWTCKIRAALINASLSICILDTQCGQRKIAKRLCL